MERSSAPLLLLRAVRAWTGGGAPPSPDGADWAGLFDLAEEHGLLPLLDHVFHGAGALPAEALAALRERAAERVRASFRLTAELLAVVDALEGAGVAVIPYKGPLLALEAYGSVGLRQFVDLDLLVRPGDLDRAAALLRERGYAAYHRFTPGQEAEFRRIDGDYPFHHPETGLLVEVHVRVSSERFVAALDTEELFRRARRIAVGRREVLALRPDDHLLVLAVHGSKHRWHRLEWVVGVAALLRVCGGLDWRVYLARAGELRARRVLLLALVLARDLAGVELPREVVRRVEGDAGVRALASEVAERMFAGDGGEATSGNLLFNLRAKDGWMDRVRYTRLWLTVPTPEDWKALPLPDALLPLYALLRPARLLARYGGRRPGS
ncbi:MAG TPA: nucleotidyltransferase family protein [Longimicrobium sp.]|nr:nucleotidyltransferase family protein [Longimicrobium sp.]